MSSKSFSLQLIFNQSSQIVFDSINNVRGWWQGKIEGNTTNINDEFNYRMEDFHFSKQRIVEFIRNKKVIWLVTESNLTFANNKQEWTGTKIIFEISEINKQTHLQFTHLNLVPEFECYNDCSNAWTILVQESLVSLIKTGKGKKVF